MHSSTAFSHEVRRVVTDSLIGNGVFSQDGAAWKHSRSLLKPSLFQKHYNDSTLIEEHVDNFISRIATEHIVDLQPLFFCLTLDLTTSFLFGKSVYSLKQDQGRTEKEFSQAFQYAQVYLSRRYQLGRLCWLLNGKKYRDSCSIVHGYIDGIVQNAVREKNSSHPDGHRPLLGELVLDVDDPVQARDHLIHLLLAGRDTAACLLSWTLYELFLNLILPQTLIGQSLAYSSVDTRMSFNVYKKKYQEHLDQAQLILAEPENCHIFLAFSKKVTRDS